MTGREIISKYVPKISGRPEYYSGRGAIVGDLNSPILEDVYKGVKAVFGDKAAGCFVQFVYDQDKLSATLFLNAFYSFVAGGCVWQQQLISHDPIDELDVGPDHDDGRREAVGFAMLGAFMGGMTDRDQTVQIRGEFLLRHKKEFSSDPKRQAVQCNSFGYHTPPMY